MRHSPLHTRGFTLLYTLLIISLVLAVSASVLNIIVKEVTLSGFSRDSQIAYYAAESAAECALFYALNGEEFDGDGSIICNNVHIFNVEKGIDFEVTFPGSTACAVVRITDVGSNTVIESRGRNICTPTIRRVERGLRVVF